MTLAKAKVKHIYSTGVIYDHQNIFIVQATGLSHWLEISPLQIFEVEVIEMDKKETGLNVATLITNNM
jgi:hypothetical protein